MGAGHRAGRGGHAQVALANAGRLLERYRGERLTFNDDIQGTGAVNPVAFAAAKATGVPLAGHRIMIFGMGTAGAGIADQVTMAMVAEGAPETEARRRFWAVDRQGLLRALRTCRLFMHWAACQ
jgi:malate dehydrogenase (oxaloacetate-decarboxylating)